MTEGNSEDGKSPHSLEQVEGNSNPEPPPSSGTRWLPRLLFPSLLLSLLLWNMPYGYYLLYPFKLFSTWLHEISHALAMLATGAGLDRIEIYADTSGLTYPKYGVTPTGQIVISSAGYIGTALVGCGLFIVGHGPRYARATLLGLAGSMLVSGLLLTTNNFGRGAVIAIGLIIGLLALQGRAAWRSFVVQLLALQACLNALLDIRVLFANELFVAGRLHDNSDADVVARVAGGPPWLWALLWLAWSLLLLFVALRVTSTTVSPRETLHRRN